MTFALAILNVKNWPVRLFRYVCLIERIRYVYLDKYLWPYQIRAD